jgi:hypothetical protein
MSAALVKRLKEAASERHGQGSGTSRWDPNSDEEKLLDEAADALEASLSERDEWRACATEFKELCSEWEARATALEEALEPFAAAIIPDATCISGYKFGMKLTSDDFIRARAALSAKGGAT